MTPITLTCGAITLDVLPPVLGYSATVEMGLHFLDKNNGLTSVFDDGSAYDRRQFDGEFLLPTTDAAWLTSYLLDEFTKGDVTMTLAAGSGFFPFGPDLGDEGEFQVAFTTFSIESAGDSPRNYWRIKASASLLYSPPYVLPSQTWEGDFRIGSVRYLRYPQEMTTVDVSPAAAIVVTRDGSVYQSEDLRGVGREISFSVESLPHNMAHLITGLLAARGSTTSIYGFYPVGPDIVSAYYPCRISSPTLTMVCKAHRLWEVGLNYRYVG